MNTVEQIVHQFGELEKRLNGSKSLPIHDLRSAALDSLKANGLPGLKDEEYKFTRLSGLIDKQLDLAKKNNAPSIGKDQITDAIPNNFAGSVLVFINDEYSEEYSSIDSSHQDISFQSLNEASKNRGNANYFTDNKHFDKDGFLAWNTALTENGIAVEVPANKVYEKPIALYFLSDAQSQQVVNLPKVQISLGKNSEVTFIEKFVTIGDHISFNNVAVEIIAEEDTRGKYIKVQNDGENTVQVNNVQVYQPGNSTFSVYTFTFSGKMVRNNLHIVIDGEGSEANMYGLYLTKGTTHVDNHTNVDHRKPNSFSNELYKGIMDENSRGVFNGKIFVRQAAQKTNAFQSNNNILLSDDATVNTKPQLEIWADDVKCSHGCTTGQLDEEQIFYLRSRGIDKDSAQTILLQAFAKDVLDKITIESLRAELEGIIEERLS